MYLSVVYVFYNHNLIVVLLIFYDETRIEKRKHTIDLLNKIEKMDIKADGLEKNSIDVLNKVNKAYNESIGAGNKAKLVLQSAVEVVDSLQHLENNIADYTENQMNRDAILAESEQILLELPLIW